MPARRSKRVSSSHKVRSGGFPSVVRKTNCEDILLAWEAGPRERILLACQVEEPLAEQHLTWPSDDSELG